jgi:hypothetical protein
LRDGRFLLPFGVDCRMPPVCAALRISRLD